MDILEPVLVKTDTITGVSSTVSELEVDFNFAALEGALILQTMFSIFLDNIPGDIEQDNYWALGLNYNPSFAPATALAGINDDFTFSFWNGVFIAAGTPASLESIPLASPLYTHDSVLIVRNPSLWADADAGAPTMLSKIWYKRVIFSEAELVPFVALRR